MSFIIKMIIVIILIIILQVGKMEKNADRRTATPEVTNLFLFQNFMN